MFILNNTEGEEPERNSTNEPETECEEQQTEKRRRYEGGARSSTGGHHYVEGSQRLCLPI